MSQWRCLCLLTPTVCRACSTLPVMVKGVLTPAHQRHLNPRSTQSQGSANRALSPQGQRPHVCRWLVCGWLPCKSQQKPTLGNNLRTCRAGNAQNWLWPAATSRPGTNWLEPHTEGSRPDPGTQVTVCGIRRHTRMHTSNRGETYVCTCSLAC